jgi:phosphoglycolate phosphatase-like HAD superfamily hydrolase
MVGDTPFDARAATGCGVKAIGVLTGVLNITSWL